MSLLDRMVLREILVPLGVGLLAILQLLVIIQLLQLNDVVFGSAVTLGDLGRVTLALAPHFLVVTVPLAYMLGIQLGIGRLAGDSELVALSAAGVHPARLFRVPIAIGCVLALAVAGLTRWAEPWGMRQLNQILNNVIKRNLKEGVVPGVFNDGLPRFMIYVGGVRQGNWRGVLIEDDVGDGAPLLALAEEGHIAESGGEALTLRLQHGELHRFEPHGETVVRFQDAAFLVGVQERVSRKNRFSAVEGQLTAVALEAQIAEAERNGWMEDAARMRMELLRRWSVPLACLAFALLGVPLAMGARGTRSSAYLVTLGAFVGYYALSRLGIALAEQGNPAWLAAFIPNLAVAALGLFFSARIIRNGLGHLK